MSGGTIIKFVNPWKFRREQAERLRALRLRDGDNCRRCKRPLRFDLPDGHDLRARIEAHLHCAGEPVTASIGHAMLQRGEDAATWLARADAALYRAKAAGRNRIEAAGTDGDTGGETGSGSFTK